MKLSQNGAVAALVFLTLAVSPLGLKIRDAQSSGNTTFAADSTSAFDSLSLTVQPAGQCSLMGGLVLPNVSARCCFSVQVATQRGLSEYGMAEPCKAAWRCEEDGITPDAGFEEQARTHVCAEPTCLSGVTAAMRANWKTAKAAEYMNGLCEVGAISVAKGTEAGLIRADMEGMSRPPPRRRRRRKSTGRKRTSKAPACFPGEALVQVLGRGAIPMASLRVGESVLTAEAEVGAPLKYEPVLTWIHLAKGTEASYTTIHHEQGILRASPGHLVFSASASGAYVDVTAGSLVKGDILLAAKEGGLSPSKVLFVEHDSVSLGMYAPLTHSGAIVVDGVLASNYATPSLDVRLPHWLAHAGLLPVRAFHSSGFAKLFTMAREALFGADDLEGLEIVDVMHPYFGVLYYGLHVQKLLPNA